MIDQEQIANRLINWGLCQRGRGGGVMLTRETRRTSPYGGQGYVCMTAVACNIVKMAALGPAPSKTAQSSLDFEDAAIIQRAWQQLPIRHRLLLRDYYVLGQSPNTICRNLNIKHIPASHWNRALAEARDAIDDIMRGGNR